MLGATMVIPTVPVSNLERAKAFYGPTLGLTVRWENPASVRFRCGEVSHRPRHPGRFQAARSRKRSTIVEKCRKVERSAQRRFSATIARQGISSDCLRTAEVRGSTPLTSTSS